MGALKQLALVGVLASASACVPARDAYYHDLTRALQTQRFADAQQRIEHDAKEIYGQRDELLLPLDRAMVAFAAGDYTACIAACEAAKTLADVVTAVNALHLADQGPALAEVRRVLAPDGLLALAGWAERSRNELGVLEAAVAAADGEPPAEDPEDRLPGGLEAVLAAGGFALVAADLVEATWTAVDDEALVAGVLLGEDVGTKGELGPAVVAAAAPFRSSDGVVRLRNHLRGAVGRR